MSAVSGSNSNPVTGYTDFTFKMAAPIKGGRGEKAKLAIHIINKEGVTVGTLPAEAPKELKYGSISKIGKVKLVSDDFGALYVSANKLQKICEDSLSRPSSSSRPPFRAVPLVWTPPERPLQWITPNCPEGAKQREDTRKARLDDFQAFNQKVPYGDRENLAQNFCKSVNAEFDLVNYCTDQQAKMPYLIDKKRYIPKNEEKVVEMVNHPAFQTAMTHVREMLKTVPSDRLAYLYDSGYTALDLVIFSYDKLRTDRNDTPDKILKAANLFYFPDIVAQKLENM
jgi:hypothetical protein